MRMEEIIKCTVTVTRNLVTLGSNPSLPARFFAVGDQARRSLLVSSFMIGPLFLSARTVNEPTTCPQAIEIANVSDLHFVMTMSGIL
jgi:hypothetical protein